MAKAQDQPAFFDVRRREPAPCRFQDAAHALLARSIDRGTIIARELQRGIVAEDIRQREQRAARS